MEDLVSFMQWHKERGPVQKEEEMDRVKTNCKTCGIPLLNSEVCYKCSDRTAERHARFERAYMAALTGYCSRPYYDAPDGQRQELNPSRCARIDAFETVRQWDSMMAQLDGGGRVMDPTRVQQVEAETNRIFVSTGAWHGEDLDRLFSV